ncbi:MAG TPA: hypothetical protein VHV78_12050 [Gemmatimonadaceae bacterium]|jgi:hypothetical protein|nr:hypothetical protein [Gemmatimonadaceae bacterium]
MRHEQGNPATNAPPAAPMSNAHHRQPTSTTTGPIVSKTPTPANFNVCSNSAPSEPWRPSQVVVYSFSRRVTRTLAFFSLQRLAKPSGV